MDLVWISTKDYLPGVIWNQETARSASSQILFTDYMHDVHAGNFVIGPNTGFFDFSMCTENKPMAGFFSPEEVLAWMRMPAGYESGLNQHDN